MPTVTEPRTEEREAAPPPVPEAPPAAPEPEFPAERPPRRPRFRRRPVRRAQRPLPIRTRIILGTAGGLLVVLGIAGLFLPFLQGILFLVLAAAVLSLTSRRIYQWLERTVGDRWPHAWQRVERFRTRVRWMLRDRKR